MDTQPTKRKKKEHEEEEALRGNVRTPLACLLLPHSTIQHMTAADCGDLTTPQLLDAVCTALPKEEVYDARPVSHTTPPFRYCLSRCPADQFGFLGRRMVAYPHDFVVDPPPRYRYCQLTPPFVLHQDIYDMTLNMVVPQYTLHVAVDTLSNIFEDPPPDPTETDDDGAADKNDVNLEEGESEDRSIERQHDDEKTDRNSCCSYSSSASSGCDTMIPSRCYNAIKDIVNDFGRGLEVELTHLFGNIEYDQTDLCCFPLIGTQRIVSSHDFGREEDGGWRLHLSVESVGSARPLIDIAFNVPPSDISRSFGVKRWAHELVVEKFSLSDELREYLSNFDNLHPLCKATDDAEKSVMRFIPTNFLRSARCEAVTLSKSWSTVQVVSSCSFAEMTSLTSLDIDCCADSLSVILESFCHGATALRKMDMRRYTKLEVIQDRAFTACENLRVLHLPPNLTEIPSVGNGNRPDALKTWTSSSIVVFGGLNEALPTSSKPSKGADQIEDECSLNFPQLRTLALSFCCCAFLTKLDFSGSTSHLERMSSVGSLCPSLHTVIFGDLPKLECIDGSFFDNSPSLRRVDLGSAPLLRRMRGSAFRNAKLLDFDMLTFQRSRNSENRYLLDCRDHADKVNTPFLDGSLMAKTMDWVELLKIMQIESLPYLWYSYLHHWNIGSINQPLETLIDTALSLVELKMPQKGSTDEEARKEAFHDYFILWKILLSLGAVVQNGPMSTTTRTRRVYIALKRCSLLMVRVWESPQDKRKFGLAVVPIAMTRTVAECYLLHQVSSGLLQREANLFERAACVFRSCRLVFSGSQERKVDDDDEVEHLKIAECLFRMAACRFRLQETEVRTSTSSETTATELEKDVRGILQCPDDQDIFEWIRKSSTRWDVFREMNEEVFNDKGNNHLTSDLLELAANSRIGPK